MRNLLFINLLLLSLSGFTQLAPGIMLNGSVNNATIDTCDVDFFDSGGYEEHC